MKVHERATDIIYFEDIESGIMPFHVCFNDCNYEVGDIIELKAHDDEADSYVKKDLNADIGEDSTIDVDWLYCEESEAETVRLKILKVIHYGKEQGGKDDVILEFEVNNLD